MHLHLYILHLFCLVLSLLLPNYKTYASCPSLQPFDFIVVGSGSGGGVVATRLSERKNVTVLLLEAGKEPLFVSTIPLISYKALGTTMDWEYLTEPQENCCSVFRNKQVYWPRGKALGGTSSINFMTYTRGNRHDYDFWASLGNRGWSYKDVFPYFLKLEDYRVKTSPETAKYHRRGGPVAAEEPDFKTDLAEAFLKAGQELGYDVVDYNAAFQTGFNYPPVSIRNGKRESTYTAYIKPNIQRPNLKVLSPSFVTKILFDNNNRAIGVTFDYKEVKGSQCKAFANKEVILSAGTVNSPQLLLLSGVGPRKTLRQFKIPVVTELPGVGQNLQDHVIMGMNLYTIGKKVSYNSVRYSTVKNLHLWNETGSGPMACPEAFEGVAYIKSDHVGDMDWPDIEIFMNTDNAARMFKKHIDPLLSMFIPNEKMDAFTLIPILLRPQSRGYITLKSINPYDPPKINPRYLTNRDDVNVLVQGVRKAREIARTKAFYPFHPFLMYAGFFPACSHRIFNRDAYDECVTRAAASTGYHPTSTCAMGPETDPLAVVDCRLRVYGVSGLRVVDASVMPRIISGHTAVPTMMIGEKAAAMILEELDRGAIACD